MGIQTSTPGHFPVKIYNIPRHCPLTFPAGNSPITTSSICQLSVMDDGLHVKWWYSETLHTLPRQLVQCCLHSVYNQAKDNTLNLLETTVNKVLVKLIYIRSTCDALSRPCSRLTSAFSAWILCTRFSATSLLLLLPSTIIAWELRGDDGPDTGWSSFCCSIL